MGILAQSIRGGSWLTLGYIVERLIGVLSFFVLARLLAPADFGVLAIALLLPKFLQSVTEPGFSTAAQQREGNILPYLNPIWSLRVVRSTLIAVLIFFAGSIVAAFFHIAHATLAIRLGGVAFLILNLGNIGEIFFFKELDFKKVFIRNLVRQLAYIATAIGIAVVFPTYWALVIGTFALHATETISTYILHPYRPCFTLKWTPLKDLAAYSKWIFGQGILDQIYALIESTVVGRVAGASAMGLYSKAKSLAGVVPGFLTSVINTVSFSAYAKLKDEQDKVRDGFLKSMDLLSLIVIPAIAVVLIAGGKLILLVLGPAWLPMTDPLRVLMIYYALGTVLDISYRLLSGIGKPDKKVKLDLVKTTLTVALIIFLTPRYNILGTAFALLIGVLPALVIMLGMLKRAIGLRYGEFLKSIIVPLGASAVIIFPLIFLKETILGFPLLISLSFLTLLGMLYLLILIGIGKKWKLGPYHTVKIVLRHVTPYG